MRRVLAAAIASLLVVLICFDSAIGSTIARYNDHSALIDCNGTSVFENEDERMKVSDKIKYTWTYEGSPIEKLDEFKGRWSISKFGDLLINDFTEKDHGEYRCKLDYRVAGYHIVEIIVKPGDRYVVSDDMCPVRSCISASKCSSSGVAKTCPGKGDICCSIIEESAKHQCRHFNGECMDFCHTDITVARADDCEIGRRCCVLLVL